MLILIIVQPGKLSKRQAMVPRSPSDEAVAKRPMDEDQDHGRDQENDEVVKAHTGDLAPDLELVHGPGTKVDADLDLLKDILITIIGRIGDDDPLTNVINLIQRLSDECIYLHSQ